MRPRRADVREQIVGAAAAFVEHSYAEVSVTVIAAAAGFTKGAVHSNFEGKPQLFAAVFAEQFTELVGGALRDALAAVDTSGSDAPRAAAATSPAASSGVRCPRCWPSSAGWRPGTPSSRRSAPGCGYGSASSWRSCSAASSTASPSRPTSTWPWPPPCC